MPAEAVVEINGRNVPVNGERNLLEVIRKANIDLPTFCYHSQLSAYGACRLCLVDIEGKGIVSSCSLVPEPGAKIRTHTPELREMRRMTLELLLANHEMNCPTCSKSADCQLQELARRMGVNAIRFKRTHAPRPIDTSSPFLLRDPGKCVLCGDCVRMCKEVQGIGAIDFAFRGAAVSVIPAFGKNLDQVECVGCGQCATVCPTAALVVRSDVGKVYSVLADKNAGKPPQVIEKIVESGLRTYYKEVCLLEQAFIHDTGKSVAQAVKEAEGKVGAPIKIAGFVRYALGEGIEKQESDFAAEVAAASGKK